MTKRARQEPSVERLQTLFQVPVTIQPEGSKKYYQSVLESICHELLHDFDLVIGRSNKEQNHYAILEAEVYFKTTPKHHHDDPFTHAHPLQYQNGVWFFHHVGNSKGYRGGSRKGMDVTLTGEDSGGGILLRAVKCMTTNKVIEGPSLLVDLILKTLGYTSIKDMVNEQFEHGDAQPCWDTSSGLFFAPKPPHSTAQEPLASYRIGLGLKNHSPSFEKRLNYVCRPYRFVMSPRLLQKGKVWTLMEMIRIDKMDLDVTKKVLETYQDSIKEGRTNAEALIKSCARGHDIMQGGTDWKVQLMSAILWWNEQTPDGKLVDLDLK